MGNKVAVSIAALLIPAEILFDDSFIGAILALGVVAMALSESDVHPRGMIRSAALSLVLFFATSSLVELLAPLPPLFALLIILIAFCVNLLGGINSRMQGITFGVMLIFAYTMLGADNTPPEEWWLQPTLYTLGGLAYATVSIILLYRKPYRLLKENLSSGFSFLSDYIYTKADLFGSEQSSQNALRNQLAQKNIALAQQIEICKQKLYGYSQESGYNEQKVVDKYYQRWFLLQEMQERAISSHEQYDVLTEEVDGALLEGYGQLMREIGKAMQEYAETLLTDQPYRHPLSLIWTVAAVENMLEKEKYNAHYHTLVMLLNNLKGLERNLREEETLVAEIDVSVFNTRKPESHTFKDLLKLDHPRFKSAFRLTLSWLLGYLVVQVFHIEKGSWILLTSLLVMQQTYSATRIRLFHRVLGTTLGVILALTLAHLLPTTQGQILILLGSIYMFFYWLKQNYVIAAVFITTFVLASFNLQDNQGVAVMFPRILDTFIGAIITYVVVRFAWPDWQSKLIPGLLHNAVVKNIRYFESIYQGNVSEETYLHNRRSAYNADNELTSAWKGMRIEPKNTRQYQDSAFNLTSLNHALLSYISAFGIHKHTYDLTEEEKSFCLEVSIVLKYVAIILSSENKGKGDVERLVANVSAVEVEGVEGAEEDDYIGVYDYEQIMRMTRGWENKAEELVKDEFNTKIGLIYNIAHVSRQILLVAKGLVTSE
jgi:uncharacterized membrane protein (TIGR01666 family)